MPATNLLFICSRNKIRSLTAEALMADVPGFRAASAGTQRGARVLVTSRMLRWADIVVCMEKSHREKLRARFPEELEGKRIITLHIRDEYQYMDEELVQVLEPHLLALMEARGSDVHEGCPSNPRDEMLPLSE